MADEKTPLTQAPLDAAAAPAGARTGRTVGLPPVNAPSAAPAAQAAGAQHGPNRHLHRQHHAKKSFLNPGGEATSWVPFPVPEMASSFDVRPRLRQYQLMQQQQQQRNAQHGTAGLSAAYGRSYASVYEDSDDEDASQELDEEEEDEDEGEEQQDGALSDAAAQGATQEEIDLLLKKRQSDAAKGPKLEGKMYMRTASFRPPDNVIQSTWKKFRRGAKRLHRAARKSFGRWNELRDAPRELWVIYIMKFLSSYSYFSFALVLTMYLTDEFGMDDTEAGWAYGSYGLMSTVFGVVCGWVIDLMGVRQSLIIGALVGCSARLVLALTSSRFVVLATLYIFLPFAECLGIPILSIGIKRYTNAANRTFAFSFYYSIMNIAALIAGPLVDIVRGLFPQGLQVAGYDLSALRVVLLTSAISTFLMILAVWMGVREIEVDDDGNVVEFEPNKQSAWDSTMEVLRSVAFWRLTLFTFLMVGVRLVFRHVDATLPKYLTREFGPSAPFGLVYAINPFLIIFFVPVIGMMTREVDSYTMIVVGSYVSAIAPFWICLGNHYWAVFLFMFTLSVGEAIYSPRTYEYVLSLSSSGQEGLYSSLASAPLFSVKLIVGGMSGWLLTQYCPLHGERHSATLWAIVGASSLVSPILMTLMWELINPTKPQEETDEDKERHAVVVPPQKVSNTKSTTTAPIVIQND
ncbi:hypothetical protein FVE85_6145 [Porphyridium purpureum]|uniref:Major facilitator superfamily (MFS) profile domain-containing protein n=1 Tax=Porphyridium purpureum TaxID=35688 RepID=A0A5J4Z5P0_PORPP|nr:hypothetical protein FVE85_6145 [Porphyridium purpureum]|eukprot:POR0527..scf295_1